MSFAIKVHGGTNAGTKIVKQPRRWIHVCQSATSGGKLLVTYSCPDCGRRRPTS